MRDFKPHPVLAVALWDIGLVLGTYFGCRAAGLDDYLALVAATAMALLRTTYVLVRNRRLDGFSVAMFLIFGIGLLLSFITGDEKLLLASKSLTTAVLSMVLLGTVAVGRPAAFGVAKRFGAHGDEERQSWDHLYTAVPSFRRVYIVMTLVWAGILLAESALRLPLIYLLPLDAAVPASSVLLLASIGLIMFWSASYGKRGENHARAQAPPSSIM